MVGETDFRQANLHGVACIFHRFTGRMAAERRVHVIIGRQRHGRSFRLQHSSFKFHPAKNKLFVFPLCGHNVNHAPGQFSDRSQAASRTMKHRYLLFECLTLAVLAIAVVLWCSNRPAGNAVSLSIRAVTNDVAGLPVVLLSVTKHRTAALIPIALAHKVGSAWIWAGIPTNQMAEVQHQMGISVDEIPTLVTIHFPSSSPWRFRLLVVEPRTGLAGLVERFRHAADYYSGGGILNILSGTKPNRFSVRAYYVESEEIDAPRRGFGQIETPVVENGK